MDEPTRRWWKLSSDSWVREYLSLLGSLCSLAVIVILLIHFDHKPIFDTRAVTLNAILSVFSTISKGWLLLAISEAVSQYKWIAFARSRRRLIDFETIHQASRGPYGSIGLLFTKNAITLASLGAIITILAIAVDPFMQQLLQLQSVLTPQGPFNGHNATVTRAMRYSRGIEFVIENTSTEGPDGSPHPSVSAIADFSIQANILFGLVKSSEDLAQQVTFHCPSGNCQYSPFESLAVCSACNNITDLLKKHPTKIAQPLVLELARNNPATASGPLTNITLPNGLYLNMPNDEEFTGQLNVLMTTLSTGVPSKTITLKDYDTLLMATSFMKVFPNPTNKSATWPNLPVHAMECGLYYCVQSFNSTVVNGTMNSNATELKDMKRSSDSWQPHDRSITNVTTDLQFRSTLSSIARSDLMLGDHFNISQNAVDSISSFMQDTLMGVDDHAGITGAVVNIGSMDYQPPAMQPLYNAQSWPTLFASVALSMTNAIRNNADNIAPANGTNILPVTYYHVQWQWLALPFGLLIAGFIFLVAVQLATRSVGIPVWKSSDLAVLSRGQQAKEILAGSYLAREMEEKSKRGYTHFFEREMRVEGESQVELHRMENDATSLRPSLRSHRRQLSEFSAGSMEDHDLSLEPRVPSPLMAHR